ncbi:uncharacterized protein LOC125680931 [Ostrea edulis]|uniref:uncharacterized protein LOC125680931 n=1 Tax=Ostrea edulis TaxID=37623 RepID=UPI0020944F1F|nr:uncharacterized protein LOC125680931 [Ostrea edulis]
MMLNGTPLLILLLTTSIYVTNARMFSCACPTIRTFDQAACNSDYAVVAMVTEDPTTKNKYNLGVIRNFKSGTAPTEVYSRYAMECVKELKSGKLYALAGSIQNGKALLSLCDFSFEIGNGVLPPPTPDCSSISA